MSSFTRVLIAGGGIAGLTAATAMRRQGADVDLVERTDRWEAVGAGIAVQPNGMRALRELGLGDVVERAGARVRRWLFRDQRGDVLCDIDLEAFWGTVGPFIGIERTTLHDALRSGASSARCRLGTWITSLAERDRVVSVEFSDGSEREYDLVIGADGIFSGVRALALGATPVAYGGQMAWRSVAPIRAPELDSVQFWLGDGCFFGLCPVGGDRTYGFGNVTEPRSHEPIAGRLERLRRRFAGFGGLVRDYLASLASDEAIHCAPIEWVEAERWHVGRVLLIGDAAHASSPMMGQGGCMAMEDARVLAEISAAAASADDALEQFIARRRPRTDWVQRESRAIGDMLRAPAALRDAALREHGAARFRARFAPLVAPP